MNSIKCLGLAIILSALSLFQWFAERFLKYVSQLCEAMDYAQEYLLELADKFSEKNK